MRQKITCKMCRREGVSICGREKCAFKKRPFPPGVHGPTSRTRQTGYGIQLREKQKAKRVYGIAERQFRKYFDAAAKKKGDTGEFLTQTLEQRLDNVIYRMGLSKTRAQARQFVNHGHVLLNGKKVDVPSYLVRVGEVISLRESTKNGGYAKGIAEFMTKHDAPSWLKVDPSAMTATVLSLPNGQEIERIFDPKLIVEFYSR